MKRRPRPKRTVYFHMRMTVAESRVLDALSIRYGLASSAMLRLLVRLEADRLAMRRAEANATRPPPHRDAPPRLLT
jgi:hypothetical protein